MGDGASVLLGITDRLYMYSFTVGPPMRIPVDIALAPDDVVYIVNRAYEHPPGKAQSVKIKVIKLDDKGDDYITDFGTYGDRPGQFLWPTSIAVDKDVNVYLADQFLNRITIYNKDGEYLSHWGTQGSGDGELNWPSGLAIRDDIIFIVDGRNHRVQKFTLDGKYIGQFGSFGDGPGQLNTPWGIGLDKDGNVFVADWRNDRIQSFTADGESLRTFEKPGTGGDHSIVRLHGGIRAVPRTPGGVQPPHRRLRRQRWGHLRGRLVEQSSPGVDPGGPVHHRVRRRRRFIQGGCDAPHLRRGLQPPAQHNAGYEPGEAVLGAHYG